jgi:hypothetical protein
MSFFWPNSTSVGAIQIEFWLHPFLTQDEAKPNGIGDEDVDFRSYLCPLMKARLAPKLFQGISACSFLKFSSDLEGRVSPERGSRGGPGVSGSHRVRLPRRDHRNKIVFSHGQFPNSNDAFPFQKCKVGDGATGTASGSAHRLVTSLWGLSAFVYACAQVATRSLHQIKCHHHLKLDRSCNWNSVCRRQWGRSWYAPSQLVREIWLEWVFSKRVLFFVSDGLIARICYPFSDSLVSASSTDQSSGKGIPSYLLPSQHRVLDSLAHLSLLDICSRQEDAGHTHQTLFRVQWLNQYSRSFLRAADTPSMLFVYPTDRVFNYIASLYE